MRVSSLQARERRWPKLEAHNLENQLSARQILNLKNYDSLHSISAVAVDANSIAVGTQTGKILLFDRKTMILRGEPFEAHERKVTDIWM